MAFNRMLTSWFQPQGEPNRKPRVTTKPLSLNDTVAPTVDEETARAALEVLENRSFDRVFKRLRTEALAEFAGSPSGVSGAEQREAAYVKLHALDEIRAGLQSLADEMKLHRRISDAEPLT